MTDKIRSQFEAWHASIVVGEPPHDKYNNGDYRNVHVQRYWIGWQASREAVVVELPGKPCYRGYAAYDDAMADAAKAIEAQGLKVTP